MNKEDVDDLTGCGLGCAVMVVGTILGLAGFAVCLKLLVMAVRWAVL